ncbi:MAG: DUF47 family protein [Candidatus Heimdallarchaeota archaeon]|nr:MAG: DUF47 family protein [Candidatus Heimdallarchaeota archaeon]
MFESTGGFLTISTFQFFLGDTGGGLMQQLSTKMQLASEKLAQAIKLWLNHDTEKDVWARLDVLVADVIEIEESCDSIKEELIDFIFDRSTVLPAMTSDYYRLVNLFDQVVNRTEATIRKLAARKDFPQRIPHEIPEIADRQYHCTCHLHESLQFLKEDRTQIRKVIDHIDAEREAARELDFHIFGRLVSPDYNSKDAFFCQAISASLISVIEATENASNFIRALSAKIGARPSDLV